MLPPAAHLPPDEAHEPQGRGTGLGAHQLGRGDEHHREKLQETMDRYGGESIFGMSGTSRIWGMFAYGALGQLVGSPNMCIPWQVCKARASSLPR